jgi:hypothetical protein
VRIAREWFTYFIQAARVGHIKIGRAIDPLQRLAELQTGSPVKLELLAVLRGDHEAMLHRKFADLRIHGEWFRPGMRLDYYLWKKFKLPRVIPTTAQFSEADMKTDWRAAK